MTTAITTTPFPGSSTDANFRTWVNEIHNMLIAVGIVATADTGQFDLVSGTGPGAVLNSGTPKKYRIYRFDDALQATAPIFIRLEFGNGSNLTRIFLGVGIATSTDGAGNLVNPIMATAPGVVNIIGASGSIVDYTTARPTFVCHVPGFLGFAYKADFSGATNGSGFMISRSPDASGLPTSEGVHFHTSGSSISSAGAYNFATGFKSVYSQGYCFIPGEVTATLVSGEAQAYRHYMALPKAIPNHFVVTVNATELPAASQFSLEVIPGWGAKNFLSLYAGQFPKASVNVNSGYIMAMRWE